MEWLFDDRDAETLRSWQPGDTIVVTSKSNIIWGSNYKYLLVNKSLGSSVSVNPYQGPIKFGQFTTWVKGIDKKLGQVHLLNGQGDVTVWEVAPSDMEFFRDWAVNDRVIVGENDSWLWWMSSFSYIIYNVNMNHDVRMRQVSSNPSNTL